MANGLGGVWSDLLELLIDSRHGCGVTYRALLSLTWVVCLAGGCFREAQSPEKPGKLRVLCGSSMATPAQSLCDAFLNACRTESTRSLFAEQGYGR